MTDAPDDDRAGTTSDGFGSDASSEGPLTRREAAAAREAAEREAAEREAAERIAAAARGTSPDDARPVRDRAWDRLVPGVRVPADTDSVSRADAAAPAPEAEPSEHPDQERIAAELGIPGLVIPPMPPLPDSAPADVAPAGVEPADIEPAGVEPVGVEHTDDVFEDPDATIVVERPGWPIAPDRSEAPAAGSDDDETLVLSAPVVAPDAPEEELATPGPALDAFDAILHGTSSPSDVPIEDLVDPAPPVAESAAADPFFVEAVASEAQAPQTDPTAVFQAHVRAARSDFESQVAHARDQFEEANERIKQRTGRNLILAILIGVGIGAVVILSLIFLKWPFAILALGAALFGIFELTRALQGSGRKVDLIPQLIVGTGLVVSGYLHAMWTHWVVLFLAVAFVIVWRLVAQMIAKDGRIYGAVLDDVLTAGFIPVYVPFMASLCVVLLEQDHGEWWVLAFIIVAVSADVGAYATGLSFGKHPMAPRISPNKTWEGFAGAAAACLIAGVLLAMFMLHLPWWTGLILGAVILGTATAGDLGESMIKRDMGIKDMSSWLPGHGGVLDRLDSILLSAAAALALYYLLIPLAAA
jgi:phosphatidate cytidylyltransferase